MAIDRWRCAADSAERGERIHGTASRVRRWVVIEQPGPWGRDALLESRLDPTIGRTLKAKGRDHGVRVLLARRSGWDAAGASARCFLAHSGRDRSWMEALDVRSPAQLLGLDWALLAGNDPPGLGDPVTEPLYLVCTNGKHDACCADFGRPVVRALAEAGVEAWESSHVGGDRFAANVVCLPDGVYFGRVDPATAADLIKDYEADEIRLDHYRGRSCYSPLVQSAELFARHDTGVRQVYGLTLVEHRHVDPDHVDATFRTPDGADVAIAVERVRGAAVTLTCTADEQHEPWEYRRI